MSGQMDGMLSIGFSNFKTISSSSQPLCLAPRLSSSQQYHNLACDACLDCDIRKEHRRIWQVLNGMLDKVKPTLIHARRAADNCLYYSQLDWGHCLMKLDNLENGEKINTTRKFIWTQRLYFILHLCQLLPFCEWEQGRRVVGREIESREKDLSLAH